jgi:bifunctional enzyme CysN/CysC
MRDGAPVGEPQGLLRFLREIASPHAFFEVFVDTPLAECQRRDPKGLYARVAAGAIPNFTGIDSPYEAPDAAELRLETADTDAEALADRIVEELRQRRIIV